MNYFTRKMITESEYTELVKSGYPSDVKVVGVLTHESSFSTVDNLNYTDFQYGQLEGGWAFSEIDPMNDNGVINTLWARSNTKGHPRDFSNTYRKIIPVGLGLSEQEFVKEYLKWRTDELVLRRTADEQKKV